MLVYYTVNLAHFSFVSDNQLAILCTRFTRSGFTYRSSEAKERPKEGEGEGYPKPETEQGQEGGERDGGRRLSSPQQQVEEKEHPKHYSRYQ